MNYYFEPVNVNQWNMFEKVTDIGHIEPFLATKQMEIGDVVLIHVGKQNANWESGIYAYGVIVKGPYILENSPDDYCNHKNTVDVKIEKLNNIPIFTHEECKDFCGQFRTVHKIKDEYYSIIEKKIKIS